MVPVLLRRSVEGFDIFLSHTWQTNAMWKALECLHKWKSAGRCIDGPDELALLLVHLFASHDISAGAFPLGGPLVEAPFGTAGASSHSGAPQRQATSCHRRPRETGQVRVFMICFET